MAKTHRIDKKSYAFAQSGMTLRLRELLDAFGDGLVLHTHPHATALDREINWVAPTELPDPTRFVVGKELILTTGVGLLEGPHDRYESFVERLADADAAAIGFGTGMSHPFVPPQMLVAASRRAMPLIEVPYETPFTEISRVVAEAVIAERYELLRQGLAIHEDLSSVLLRGDGLPMMIRHLHRLVSGPAAVIDSHGRVLASEPQSAFWPIEEILHVRRQGKEEKSSELTVAPIEVAGDLVAFLCVRAADPTFDLHAIPYATTLIALEFSRRQAELTGRRELVGQVVSDLLGQRIPDRDAVRRLEAFGVNLERPATVVAAALLRPDQRIRTLPWGPQDLISSDQGPTVSALVGDELISVLPSDKPVHQFAQATRERLAAIDPDVRIGIGGSHTGANGFRLSYFEAKEALTHGPGVSECEPLNLSTLLLVNRELPISEMAENLLEPIIDHDREKGSDLLRTLSVYLDLSASASDASRKLHLHRNSLRYRLAQIERLTGHDLSQFNDRVQLWIALRALEVEGSTLS
ncbi:MAG: hypothetical protein F4Y28_13115 [Acidimicrobiia bacterium]|nr:hypothetical protein [Acidimicrobiia bacterium]MYG59062.1 hypothetical protein [Acidimicrobiia bacterium]MYJ33196.1 hypothetical protein [Acidimicrobiia bacterium]